MDIEALGSFVRAQRKERRLTQLEVAELADVSDRFLRELEHGKPTAEIGKVIEVLAVLGYDLQPVVHGGAGWSDLDAPALADSALRTIACTPTV